MEIRCGTSGFSYPAWRGSFYPAGAKAGEFLALYAARLPAVEINNTFYRMPTPRLLAGWREQVPPGFAFALKGPQRITHRKRLREVAEETAFFPAAAAALGPALGEPDRAGDHHVHRLAHHVLGEEGGAGRSPLLLGDGGEDALAGVGELGEERRGAQRLHLLLERHRGAHPSARYRSARPA